MKNILCTIKKLSHGFISLFKKNKTILGSGVTFLIALAITNVGTYFITKKLEKAGEPKITAVIESIVLLQNFSSNNCEVEIVLNITNLENKPTFLKIDKIQLIISGVDKRPFSLSVDKKIPINSYEIRKDTVRFGPLGENLLGVDSFKCIDISCKMDIYYPNGKLAETAIFDTTTSKINLIYGWEKAPYMAFYELRNCYKKHLLPKEWIKKEVQYYGTTYDCYYYSEDSSDIEINYVGERLEYKYGNDKYYPIACDSGIVTDRFIFVPHPKIENKFINIDNRDIIISVQNRDNKSIDVVKKTIGIRRGYVQVFNVRY